LTIRCKETPLNKEDKMAKERSRERARELRKRAEIILAEEPQAIRTMVPADTQKLIHELNVHQIELEMQNAELRRVQLELQEARDKYLNLYDFAPTGYFTLDHNSLIVDVNLAGGELLGSEKHRLIGAQFTSSISPDSQDAFYFHYREVLKTGIKGNCELKMLKADGAPFHAQLISRAVPEKEGNVNQCRTAVIDVTERKMAEEKQQAIIKTALDGFWICNLEGKFLEVNESYCKMTGYTREELLEMSIQDVEAVESPEETARRIKRIVAQGSDRFETQHKRKDGKITDIEISVNYFNIVEGQMFVFVHDITERKRAEEAQERLRQQLQAKISELETFSYGIAHDLRSPLVSIEGFSRLLRDDMLNHDAEKVQEDIRLLDTGVRKMHDFLNSTLEYSRAGHPIKRTRNVSFGKIVKEVMAEFAEQVSSIGATVSLADKFPRVCADKTRIAEVLTNLIQNSIKYRDKTVPLKIEIGYRLSEGEAVFFVRDNGLGIDASEAEKVFALFYRGTADGEGSGIGLTIVKKIIEAHGGRIWAQQVQAGEGTTMCFTLPRQHGTNKGDNNGKD